METETTDIIIIGAGPAGLTLSGLLNNCRTKNVVLEKDAEVYPYPRAFRNGGTSWRLIQRVGLLDVLYSKIADTGENFMRVIPGRHQDFFKTPLLQVNQNRVHYTGHVSTAFRQPVMEKELQSMLNRSDYSAVRTGCNVKSISEDGEWVFAQYETPDGVTKGLRGKFLAGADGKLGFTRKHYLEPKGVVMEEVVPIDAIWAGVYWRVNAPTPQSHPEFPLWKLGYSPEQVVSSFIPGGFNWLGNPDRFGIGSSIGDAAKADGLFHMEWEIKKEEDRETLQKDEKIREIAGPYFKQPGSRYGLKEDVEFPWECLEKLNTFSYKFAARTCNDWHLGRTILIGDAAHVFPPYGGQGVRTGMLDASGLSWRLALAVRDDQVQFNHLLKNWTVERKIDVDRALAATMRNGRLFTPLSPFKTFLRDWSLWTMTCIPYVRDWILKPKFDLDEYPYAPGLPFHESGGRYFPQVYCKEFAASTDEVKYTDDLIYSQAKKGLFQIVHLVESVDALKESSCVSYEIPAAAKPFLVENEMTTIVSDLRADEGSKLPPCSGRFNAGRIASGEEFLASSLATGREIIEEYDPMLIAKMSAGDRFVILRADFVIYAECESWPEVITTMEGMSEVIMG